MGAGGEEAEEDRGGLKPTFQLVKYDQVGRNRSTYGEATISVEMAEILRCCFQPLALALSPNGRGDQTQTPQMIWLYRS